MGGVRAQQGLLPLPHGRDGRILSMHGARPIIRTRGQQMGIEGGEGVDHRNGDEDIAADIADAVFHLAFLMAFAHRAEV